MARPVIPVIPKRVKWNTGVQAARNERRVNDFLAEHGNYPDKAAVVKFLSTAAPWEIEKIDRLLAGVSRVNWAPQPGPQLAAFCSEADIVLYGGQAGGGKGQPLDALVLTPNGWRCMGDLKVGMRVCSPTGQHVFVIAIYPLGVRQIYEVTFQDRTTCEVTDDHIWLAWKHCKGGFDDARLWTTSEIMRWMDKGEKFLIPINDPIPFTDSSRYERRRIHPYVLGVLLGDGSFGTDGSVGFCTADLEISDRVRSLVGDKMWGPYGPYGEGDTERPCFDFKFRKESVLAQEVRKYKLTGTKSHTKFIPKPYLLGSIEERWELMRGLIDTDGYIPKDGGAVCEYCTVSPQLRDDVMELARSLGAMASCLVGHPTYPYKGEIRQGREAYTLRLKFRDPSKAVWLPRKKALCNEPQNMCKRIVSIVPTRKAEAQCIKVSDVHGLYITNDYIVTHNSDLLLGVAGLQHRRAIIMRRVSTSLRALIDRSREIFNAGYEPVAEDSLNESYKRWRLDWGTPRARQIEFGAVEHEKDVLKHQGQPRDFYGFDELTEFTEYQFRFIIGWNRSTIPGQRCRVIAGSNPPTNTEGQWVIRFFAPWLDDTHPNPARPGELRWFTTIDGKDVECPNGEPFMHDGERIVPLSRTFIPAAIDDNAYLRDSGYKGTLQAMPEPLRSILLHGNFKASLQDDPWQLLPTTWLRAAQQRWLDTPRPNIEVQQIGVDVARGGAARTVITQRRGTWFDKQLVIPGKITDTGQKVAAAVAGCIRHPHITSVVPDAIGVGSSPVDFMRELGLMVQPFVASEKATGTDRSHKLHFSNKRAWAAWAFREALDPDNNEDVAIPDDPELMSDLAKYRFSVGLSGIRLEEKSETHERSPDKGDSLLLAGTPAALAIINDSTAFAVGGPGRSEDSENSGGGAVESNDAPWNM